MIFLSISKYYKNTVIFSGIDISKYQSESVSKVMKVADFVCVVQTKPSEVGNGIKNLTHLRELGGEFTS